jgi:hypothetical protein
LKKITASSSHIIIECNLDFYASLNPKVKNIIPGFIKSEYAGDVVDYDLTDPTVVYKIFNTLFKKDFLSIELEIYIYMENIGKSVYIQPNKKILLP